VACSVRGLASVRARHALLQADKGGASDAAAAAAAAEETGQKQSPLQTACLGACRPTTPDRARSRPAAGPSSRPGTPSRAAGPRLSYAQLHAQQSGGKVGGGVYGNSSSGTGGSGSHLPTGLPSCLDAVLAAGEGTSKERARASNHREAVSGAFVAGVCVCTCMCVCTCVHVCARVYMWVFMCVCA
jgi:hypothetical protein